MPGKNTYRQNQKRRASKYNQPFTAYCQNCGRTREFSAIKKCEACKRYINA